MAHWKSEGEPQRTGTETTNGSSPRTLPCSRGFQCCQLSISSHKGRVKQKSRYREELSPFSCKATAVLGSCVCHNPAPHPDFTVLKHHCIPHRKSLRHQQLPREANNCQGRAWWTFHSNFAYQDNQKPTKKAYTENPAISTTWRNTVF